MDLDVIHADIVRIAAKPTYDGADVPCLLAHVRSMLAELERDTDAVRLAPADGLADRVAALEASVFAGGVGAKSLPTWMIEFAIPIDAARITIRKSEELKALGAQHGPVKVYTREEAELIRQATVARQERWKVRGT